MKKIKLKKKEILWMLEKSLTYELIEIGDKSNRNIKDIPLDCIDIEKFIKDSQKLKRHYRLLKKLRKKLAITPYNSTPLVPS